MKYRKNPVEIEAMQLVGDAPETFKVCQWLIENDYPWLLGNALEPETLYDRAKPLERPDKGIWLRPKDGALMIRTLEGDMEAPYGWWIIKGVKGEFYSCRDDIFRETYESVEDESVEDVKEGLKWSWSGSKHEILRYENHTVVRNTLSAIAIPNDGLGQIARELLQLSMNECVGGWEETLKYNEAIQKNARRLGG